MTGELGHRQIASFLALSLGIHAIALLAPRPERVQVPLPEPPLLVFELVQAAPVTVAPEVPEPPPPPPIEEQPPPPPPPEPLVQAAPAPKPPPPKVAPVAKPVPVAKPAPVAKPTPIQPRAVEAAPEVKARYEDLLYAWLVRHKEYPLVARRRGIEGRPVVTVRIDRRGHVLSSRVSSASRYTMLDEAAVAMVRRAEPFPPVPDNVGGDSYEFTAPVEYRIR